MGRGLSYLQKGILCLAYKNLKHGWGKPCVTTAEVLMGVKHSAARVSVSRAFRRLKRGGWLSDGTNINYQASWFGLALS